MLQNYSITTVLTASASTDLTDLSTIKDELSIPAADTANDAWLARAQQQSSTAIANFCNRTFAVQLYKDNIRRRLDWWYAGYLPNDRTPLSLGCAPVVAVISIVEDGVTLVPSTDYEADLDRGFLYRLDATSGDPTNWTSEQVVVVYLSGYGSQAVQAATVPANPGPYTITVANAATFSVDVGVAYASGAPFVAIASAPAHGQYSVAAGVYSFNAADAGASVTVTYGQTKIPDDVVDAALRLVTMRFKQKGRDPMLMSQSQPNLGDKRWWVGSVPGQNGALPPEIKGLLEGAYRVPVIG